MAFTNTTAGASLEWLSRPAAAAWFAERGVVTLTERKLRRMAELGEGPPVWKEGRTPYYRPQDLADWLTAVWMVPDRAGRKQPAA